MTATIDLTAPGALDAMRPDGTITSKPNLVGLSREELGDQLRSIGVPDKQVRMRTAQLWQWIYVRGHDSFESMSNIGKPLRASLTEHFTLARPEIATQQI